MQVGDSLDDGGMGDEGNQRRMRRSAKPDREELKTAFRLAWNNRFQGTGKPFQLPDPADFTKKDPCPPIVKSTVEGFQLDPELLLMNRARIKALEHSLEAAIKEERFPALSFLASIPLVRPPPVSPFLAPGGRRRQGLPSSFSHTSPQKVAWQTCL